MSRNLNKTKAVDAFKDYMEGMSRQSIADKYGVVKQTVDVWARRGEWTAKRRKAYAEMQASLYQEYQTLVAGTTRTSLVAANIYAKRAYDELCALEAQVMASDNRPAKFAELRPKYAANMEFFVEASKVQKNALPQASEELSRMMYEELRRIGAAGLMVDDDNDETSEGVA